LDPARSIRESIALRPADRVPHVLLLPRVVLPLYGEDDDRGDLAP
jgi:hypothetical protein